MKQGTDINVVMADGVYFHFAVHISRRDVTDTDTFRSQNVIIISDTFLYFQRICQFS